MTPSSHEADRLVDRLSPSTAEILTSYVTISRHLVFMCVQILLFSVYYCDLIGLEHFNISLFLQSTKITSLTVQTLAQTYSCLLIMASISLLTFCKVFFTSWTIRIYSIACTLCALNIFQCLLHSMQSFFIFRLL